MISFSAVTKAYADRTVLDQVSFRIDPGEFVCITGPSGAGKSTLLMLLIRADLPTSGAIEVDSVDIATVPHSVLQMYRRRTGVVFQDYKLLSDRTVYENVAFAMEVCGDPDELIARRVPEVLRRIGMEGRAHAFPDELSGGEKARTALARALVHHPMIVIADEPTGNIDPHQSMEILRLLQEINRDGTTVILASHDQVLIDALQTRVLRLENGRLVRDAVGGYEAGVTHVAGSGARPHQIFEKPDKYVKTEPGIAPRSTPSSPPPSPDVAVAGDRPVVLEAEAGESVATVKPRKIGRQLPQEHKPQEGAELESQDKQKGGDDEPRKSGHVKPIAI